MRRSCNFKWVIDPQTIMAKGGWNVLGQPHDNTNSLPSCRPPRAQSYQTELPDSGSHIGGEFARVCRFQWRLKLLNSGGCK